MAKKAKFEVYQSKKNKNWYGRLRAKNGEIVAVSEGYVKKFQAARWKYRLEMWVAEALNQTCEEVAQ